jgi:hypothetical protein
VEEWMSGRMDERMSGRMDVPIAIGRMSGGMDEMLMGM